MTIAGKKRVSLLILCISYLLLFSSCATLSQGVEDIKESLKKTATEYWNLRMADKYEETYKMEHKTELPPYNEYLNKVKAIKNFKITKHTIKNIEVEGNKGLVYVEFSFIMPPVTKPLVQTITDEWIYIKGKWYHKLPK